MAKREISYDSRCYDLAEIFLEDEPNLNTDQHKRELAGRIQETIESEIQWMRDQHARPAPINETETKDVQTDNKED
jgi:hypothetical protein